MAKFSLEEWQVTQLRLTVFSAPQSTVRRTEWWEEVAGAEPNQNITERKRNISMVSGDYGNASLTLGLAPDRVDWALAAAEGVLDPAAALQEIGPLLDVTKTFSGLAENWLSRDDLPEITRIGFGAALYHPEADHGAAYKRLCDYIPAKVDPTWRDFSFQVNVHRDVQSTEHCIRYINRLSRWFVLRKSAGQFLIGDGGLLTTSGPPSYGVRLELDINTPVDSVDPIPGAQLIPLYRELFSDATSIARDGVTNEQYRIQ